MTAPDRSESASFSCPSVGIDVSKAPLDVALLGNGEEASASRKVPNSKEGFEALLSWMEKQTDRSLEESPEQVHVCLEASGGYQRPVTLFFHERGLTVSVVNPQRTSAYADSQLARSKTDRVDAHLLARFCEREEPAPWEPSSSEQRGVKVLEDDLLEATDVLTLPGKYRHQPKATNTPERFCRCPSAFLLQN